MKKTLPVLFFLLFLLIVICVYQKTYTIYSQQTTVEGNTAKTISEHNAASQIKKEVTPKNTTEIKKSQAIPKKHALVTPLTVRETQAEKTQTEETHTEKTQSENSTLLEKIEAKVTSVLSTKKENVTPTKQVSKAGVKEAQAKPIALPVVQLDKEEQEVVDYLLRVLKERDLAIQERDKVEAQLQQLIDKALEERRIAIEHMHTEVKRLQVEQQKLIDERDITSQQLDKKNTEQKGK